MPRIFISYRRVDSDERAHRISEHLKNIYGHENVFIDFLDIPGGDDFSETIDDYLTLTDIAIVIIGKLWVEEFSKRLSEHGTDYVLYEVAYALRNAPLVIPVLIDKSVEIDEEALPSDIRDITMRNYMYVRGGSDFISDMKRLQDRINKFKIGHYPMLAKLWRILEKNQIATIVAILSLIVAIIGLNLSGFPQETSYPTNTPTITTLSPTNTVQATIPLPKSTNTIAITATENATPTITTSTQVLTATMPTIQPETTTINFVIYRSIDYVQICPSQEIEWSNITVDFQDNYLVRGNEYFPLEIISQNCWCIEQDFESVSSGNCSEDFTKKIDLERNVWVNNQITLLRSNIKIGSCEPQPNNTEPYSCNLAIPESQ